MTMRPADRPAFTRPRRLRLVAAGLATLAAAVSLAGCGSTGKGLIPTAHAGPLLGDFEEVLKAAENGGGDCTGTEAALAKTEHDFNALPASIDQGLRARLHLGIFNLSKKARELCSQQLTSTTQTTTTKTTPTTTTETTPTTTTKTTPTTTTPPPSPTPPSGGGTPAPNEEGAGEEGAGGAGQEGAGGAGPGEGGK